MPTPVHITFQDIDPSPALESRIRAKAEKLSAFHPHITQCRVAIGLATRKGHQGHIYQVRIELDVPRTPTLVVSREPGRDHAHEDVHVALRDAFAAARRRLQDVVGRQSKPAEPLRWSAA